MTCKIDGCTKVVKYKKDGLCQTHYSRFWRYGTYELTRKARYRISNPAGYQFLHEPDHILADDRGYVAEHRFVLFGKFEYSLCQCELCGRPWGWHSGSGSHVDHIDEDITNNSPCNLRPLCSGCNTRRSRKPEHEYDHVKGIEYKGVTMSAGDWAKQDFVPVKYHTIRNRLRAGWDIEKALTKPSQKG